MSCGWAVKLYDLLLYATSIEYVFSTAWELGPGCVASPTERWRCVGPLLARLSYIQGSHRAARGGTRGRTLERLDSFKFYERDASR